MDAVEAAMHEGDGTYWVHGHVRADVFAEAVAAYRKEECGDWLEDGDVIDPPPVDAVQIEYWRIQRVGDWSWSVYESDYAYFPVDGPARGAMPVTVWYG